MAANALKPIKMYSVAGRLREKNAIYEKELVLLLNRGTIRQLVVLCSAEGYYSLAVLSDQRLEDTCNYVREGENVLRMRRVNIEQEGFAPLHSVRNKSVRQYRSLDTLIASLKRCGPLPPTYLRQEGTKS